MTVDLATPAIEAVSAFLKSAGQGAWLVGGTVRDLVLKREPHDIDLVTDGDPEPLAREFADRIGGAFFTMSEEFKTCRAVSADGALNYDFTALRGSHIVEDLGERDFTADALAVELPGDGSLIDPFGGGAHLAGRELVPVSDAIFDRDPLRLLRAVRLEKTRGLVIGPKLALLIGSRAYLASRPAAERIFAELTLILDVPGAAPAIRRLDGLGLLEVILPEVTALKGITQNEFHHLDVYGHTLAFVAAFDRVSADTETFFPGRGRQLRARLDSRLAGDATTGLALSLAGLLHDIAKPNCRFRDDDGLIRFFEHDRLGADIAGSILDRFKVSGELRQAVTQLVRRHMRFEALLQEQQPGERIRLRYLRATAPFSQESILLSVCDRLSVRGVRVTEADIEHHLELAREMMELAYALDEAEPLPKLVDGNELMHDLGLAPGPLVGILLDHIQEEQQLGNIDTREQAMALAGELLESSRLDEGTTGD